jgi:hypothetical protein
MLVPARMAGAEEMARIIPQRAARPVQERQKRRSASQERRRLGDQAGRKPRHVAIHGDTGSP